MRLSDSVAVLRGVGPKRAIALREVGIETVRDLLAFFPTRHEMYPASQAIDSLKTGQLATVVGQVTQCRIAKSRRRGAGHLHVRLMDATGEIDATFFNQAFLSNRLAVGDRCQVTGTVQHDGSGARLQPKYFEGAKDESASDAPERWVAVHAKTPGVARGTLQDLVSQALAAVGDGFDPLPPAMLKRRSLCSLSAAVRSVHQPVNGESLAAAENRLLFNSLLCHALLAMQGGMGATITDRRPVVSITAEVEAKLSDLFPFEMTTGQRTATELIGLQLQQTDGLRRLLIGDVGCGKTAVGTWAIGAVLASGHQVAVLAPTTTLARQWWSELRRFQPMGEEPALLMGGTPTS
ncbi:MAG: OB-fold nucleic acid binding domain-containing protein, partial [Pirellulaceae bacterium]|nr:OB-fold nucleic acid binding domain-containing protein [Pirellulaceae bacterium]